jgi:predicted secreted protein
MYAGKVWNKIRKIVGDIKNTIRMRNTTMTLSATTRRRTRR